MKTGPEDEESPTDAHVTALIELAQDADFAHLLGDPQPPEQPEPEEPEVSEEPGGKEQHKAPLIRRHGLGVLAGGLVVMVGLLLGGIQAVKTVSGALGDTTAPTAAETELSPTTPESNSTETALAARPTGNKQSHASGTPKSADKKSEPVHSSRGAKPEKTGSTSKPVSPKSADPVRATTSQARGPVYATVGVIRNLMTHYCADLPGRTGSVEENVVVAQYTCDGGSNDNQVYQTVTQPDGTFLLRNLKSGWCLDVDGSGSVAKGTGVNTHNCLLGSQDNQMFRKEYQGDGFFLVHVKSGLCLNVSNPDGVDNKVLELRLTLFPCSTDDDHVWTFG